MRYLCAKIIVIRTGIVALVITLLSACSPNNVQSDESLAKFFKDAGVEGTFGMFDNGKGNFSIYNVVRFRDSAYLPASTYKIINSLIGIETGVVIDTNVVFKWNGAASGRQECDRDMPMNDAFRISCPPWYQELARRIGKDTMQHWIDTLGYGQRYNKFKIQNNLDTFWLDNSLKVTADEQLGVAKRLYFDQLPFQKRSQRLVRGMMLQEKNANYSLSYKTGWGFTENGHSLAWIVGWIEENQHPYFFVLQIEHPDRNFNIPATRIKLLKDILTHYGFFNGKR
ncbi:MAG: class D beta-lactamase [Chitinophagaceae bacterium]|nr:MAG: class D beta-lactamase [Chitinophagaceae bacterium]